MFSKLRAVAAKSQDALPTGTAAVGAGIAISALTSYVFVIVALNSLDGSSKAAFSAFWAVVFVVGPGFFLPLEQEIGRALSHRRSQNTGGRPLVERAARLGAIITAVLIVLAIAATPILAKELYHGDTFFAVSLSVALVGFFAMSLTKGVLAGEGRFRAYGELIAGEGIIRLVLAVALALAGVENAALFALCLGVAPLLALPFALRSQRGVLKPGPEAPWSELSVNIGWLLAASVATQALAYAPLLGVNLLATADEKAIVTGFASAFFIARVPVLAFQAVQGTLLPKLAGLAGAGRHDEFRSGLKRLMVVVVGIGVLGTVGAFLLGPFVGKILFKDFTMDAGGLALLSAGSGVFIIALTMAQALMALGGHKITAFSWGAGLMVSIGVMAVVEPLELRVDLGLLVGSSVVAVAMAVGLWRRQRLMVDVGIGPLIDAIEHEPLEI
jgi:O-antigen/teichoic acid export membrane protein